MNGFVAPGAAERALGDDQDPLHRLNEASGSMLVAFPETPFLPVPFACYAAASGHSTEQ